MRLVWTASLLLAAAFNAGAKAHIPAGVDSADVVRDVLETPEDKIDLARAKLIFDKLLDPRVDVEGTLAKIDDMVETVQQMAGPGASNKIKLTKVRDYIYVSGDWNGYQPYQYDMTDPFGRKPGNALLSNYLATRRGNCITMPLLFVILAERLGISATISVVPFHMFVRITDDSGKTFNVEATDGGHAVPDGFYRRKTPVTDEAVKNGVYMKTLTKREAVAVLAESVASHYLELKQAEPVLTIANSILAAYPNDANAMAEQGSAYSLMIDQQYRQQYPRPLDIPVALQGGYLALADKNREAFERVEALGWREAEEPTGP